MLITSFQEIFTRDLNLLKNEIIAFKDENDLWKITGEIKNPAGNLALHIIGNLKHFIGAVLGSTGYVRERNKEFSDKNIPKDKIISGIEEVIAVIEHVFSAMKDTDLEKEFPVEFLGKREKTFFVLLQLAVHLNYHLGQVNYHRRLIAAS